MEMLGASAITLCICGGVGVGAVGLVIYLFRTFLGGQGSNSGDAGSGGFFGSSNDGGGGGFWGGDNSGDGGGESGGDSGGDGGGGE